MRLSVDVRDVWLILLAESFHQRCFDLLHRDLSPGLADLLPFVDYARDER
jgi:hypothetical protein